MIATGLANRLSLHNQRVYTGTGTITMGSEGDLVVNKAAGEATPVTLPPHPDRGDHVIIKDGKGDAATNNITLTPASSTIDGAANFVISTNYGFCILGWNGTEWNVITNGATASAGAEPEPETIDIKPEPKSAVA